MPEWLKLGDIRVEVVFKDIKNIHLSVYPPNGRVRIAAPARMNLDTLRVFAIAKLDWIRQQQKKLRAQERETPREYLDRESHFLWGKRYLLQVEEADGAPQIALRHRKMILRVRPGTSEEAREDFVSQWYRQQLKDALPGLIAKWEKRIGVTSTRFYVQRMKTRWGSCNPDAGTVRFNSELAKKPLQCLEYIVVHELTHLLERRHNASFIALMDAYMPHWRQYRTMLNASPLSHERWDH
ncbi:MAG: M48 family metallopeptidase [Proteobacteria bacterium]|nr:M48 family metallopeptidase [Pseudomonadota bacterium]